MRAPLKTALASWAPSINIIIIIIIIIKRGYPRDYYLSSEYPAHTASWFAKLKILDIFGISNFHVVKFMFCYHHHLLPFSFFLF